MGRRTAALQRWRRRCSCWRSSAYCRTAADRFRSTAALRCAALHARAIVSRQDEWAQVPYVWAARQHDALRKAADHSRLLEQARPFLSRPHRSRLVSWHGTP
jgi:hypothetical protein